MKMEVPRSGPEVNPLRAQWKEALRTGDAYAGLTEEERAVLVAKVERVKRAYFRKADARAAEGRRRIFPQEGTE